MIKIHTCIDELMLLAHAQHLDRLPLRLQRHSLQAQLHVVLPFGGACAEVVHGHLPQALMAEQGSAVLQQEKLRQLCAISESKMIP